MDNVEVSTVVHLPAEEIYGFLVDFPRYADYSKYLSDVHSHGDGSPGTRYDLTFAWWKLSYTAQSEVTDVDPPHRIDWRLTRDIDARGFWGVEPEPEAAPEGVTEACRVRFVVSFAPGSADESAIDLPRLVSLDWLIAKVKPKVVAEVERVVRRVVADLEGQRRDVTLTVHETPDSI